MECTPLSPDALWERFPSQQRGGGRGTSSRDTCFSGNHLLDESKSHKTVSASGISCWIYREEGGGQNVSSPFSCSPSHMNSLWICNRETPVSFREVWLLSAERAEYRNSSELTALAIAAPHTHFLYAEIVLACSFVTYRVLHDVGLVRHPRMTLQLKERGKNTDKDTCFYFKTNYFLNRNVKTVFI